LICAKYGKDLLNICYVIGRKKVAQFFFDSQFILVALCMQMMLLYCPVL